MTATPDPLIAYCMTVKPQFADGILLRDHVLGEIQTGTGLAVPAFEFAYNLSPFANSFMANINNLWRGESFGENTYITLTVRDMLHHTFADVVALICEEMDK